MDNLDLYFELNGIKYIVDKKTCSLDFTVSSQKDGSSTACLEITADGKSVYLDLAKAN